MINKFQQGGQAGSQEQAIVQFIQGIAEVLQADPQQVAQIAQQNPKALESAVQVYQQTQDIQQAAQAFAQSMQQQTQAARHGAKLNYIKSLKHQCAEDEELYYYKKGGRVGCGCKKKEDGGEIKKAQKGTKAVDKFKKDQAAKDSIEANVHNNQDIQNNVSGKTPGDYKKNKQGKMQWTPDRTKAPYKRTEKKEKGGEVKKVCGGSAISKFKAACGKKLNKH